MIERFFIEEHLKKIHLENYLKKELEKAGFTGMTISKTPLVTRIVLNVTRPGLAIGKGGKNIQVLTKEIEENYKIQNPQIEINEIQHPNLDARATVDKIIMLLERGYSWRSVIYKIIEDIMADGAQGVELVIRGKLSGKGGRKMKQRIAKGYMKKAGAQTALVDYAKGDAYPKAGAIGIKLRIIKPGVVFPDKLNVEEELKKRIQEGVLERLEVKKQETPEPENGEKEKSEKPKTRKKKTETGKEEVEKHAVEEKVHTEKKEKAKEEDEVKEEVPVIEVEKTTEELA